MQRLIHQGLDFALISGNTNNEHQEEIKNQIKCPSQTVATHNQKHIV